MMTNGIIRNKFVAKDSSPTVVPRPATATMNFCSPSEEDYFEMEVHSPTDSSEDSVEVKICPISVRNKRKCAEPRKVPEHFTGPLKKRMCLKIKAEVSSSESHPFRPWSPKPSVNVKPEPSKSPVPTSTSTKSESIEIKDFSNVNFAVPSTSSYPQNENDCLSSYFRPPSPIQRSYDEDQPVALINKRDKVETNVIVGKIKSECDIKCSNSSSNNSETNKPRVPFHPQITKLSTAETERIILNTAEAFPALNHHNQKPEIFSGKREQRNYKNMTRERRIEANARERTRVHTISAAFETLRKSVPSYSHNQKLSKLSVLRIACSYIMTLSSIVSDGGEGSTAECVDDVTKTIQREGKLRKKKDDND